MTKLILANVDIETNISVSTSTSSYKIPGLFLTKFVKEFKFKLNVPKFKL